MTTRNNGFSRRSLFQGIASAAALGTLGTVGAISQQAKAAASDRKFLFFFAGGGWDATPLDPKYAQDGVSPLDTANGATDMDPDTVLGQLGNLTWSSGPDRVAMDRYFSRWGNRTALLRGVNVHSAGHEAGMQWMMTGTSTSSRADWPTILASNGVAEYPMPHLVFSGPSYPGSFGAAVVRGGGGTLLDLIDGSINGRADKTSPVFTTPQDAMMDAFVFDRAAKFSSRTRGLGEVRSTDLLGNLERAMELEGRRFEAGLDDLGRSMLDQAMMAVEVMRLGMSRTAMVGIRGGWDTHGGNQNVGTQLDSFFAMLDELFLHLSTTPGTSAPWLIDEVTIVCCSELGRTPRFNGAMGRDHWPYTSMMVAGGGIKGNRTVGATTDGFIGENIDFATGQISASGDVLGTENVGTGLLKLGGVDPDRFLQGVQPATAFIQEG